MNKRFIRWAAAAASAACVLALPQAAWSQNWPVPGKQITLVVGFSAGAGTDILARALAEKLTTRLGQSVIVENKPGASGMLAMGYVSKAAPDGNTLLFVPNTLTITPHVVANAGANKIDVLTDLTPVIQATKGTLMLVASANLGAKDAKSLTELARKQPGLTFGTAGNGTPMQIAGELYKRSANINITHVAYKGTAPALTDLVGGHVSMAFTSLASVRPYLSDGRIVPIGIIQKERSPLLPNVPTMTEQGVPGIELTTWFGVLTSKGTPASIVDKINREINAVLATPELQAAFTAQGEVPVGGTAKAYADLVRSDYEFYGKVVRELGIKAD